MAQDNVGEITKIVSVTDSTVTFPTIVVGADAAPADIVGAINVGVRLAAEAGQTKTVTTAGAAAAGVESEEVPINVNISASGYLKSTVKNADVPGVLKDSTLSFSGAVGGTDNYDFQEKILITNTADMQIETSATKNKDFEDSPALFIKTGKLAYNWTFDENFNTSEVSSDYPLEIEILGRSLKITDVGANQITAEIANEYRMTQGDSVVVDDKTVTVHTIGSDSVDVTVDGESAIVGSTEKTVGGIKVKAESILYQSQTPENSVVILMVGEELTKTYNDGDPYIGEDKNNPIWTWDLGAIKDVSADEKKYAIGVKYAKTLNSPDDNPPGPGEAIVFPENYIQLGFDGMTTHTLARYTIEYADGVDLTVDDAGENDDANVIKISTGALSDAIYLPGANEYSDTIYLYANSTFATGKKIFVFYEDSDNNILYSETTDGTANDNFADITYQDVTLDLEWANTTASGGTPELFINEDGMTLDGTTAGNYSMDIKFDGNNIDGLGTNKNKEDGEDLSVYGTEVGTREESVLTHIGAVLVTPKSFTASDKVEIDVPSVQVKGILTVGPVGGVTAVGDVT
ncbi:MAG: hypothetical protein ACE5J7_01030, partial [Candidatus Aenigmatarchaeota archaeon]